MTVVIGRFEPCPVYRDLGANAFDTFGCVMVLNSFLDDHAAVGGLTERVNHGVCAVRERVDIRGCLYGTGIKRGSIVFFVIESTPEGRSTETGCHFFFS